MGARLRGHPICWELLPASDLRCPAGSAPTPTAEPVTPQDLINQSPWWVYALIPFIAAVIGWGTNVVALKMTFYPIEFCGWKLWQPENSPLGAFGWQGIIPTKAGKMAGICARLMTEKLIDVKEVPYRRSLLAAPPPIAAAGLRSLQPPMGRCGLQGAVSSQLLPCLLFASGGVAPRLLPLPFPFRWAPQGICFPSPPPTASSHPPHPPLFSSPHLRAHSTRLFCSETPNRFSAA